MMHPRFQSFQPGCLVADFAALDTANARNDLPHYQRLFGELRNSGAPLRRLAGKRCAAFGGGRPKFESFMHFEQIDVLDAGVDRWIPVPEDVATMYGGFRNVTWQTFDFSRQSWEQPYDVATFAHSLEHVPADRVAGVLASVDPEAEIVIYGPDLSAAKDASWFHFRPLEHLALFNRDWLKSQASNRPVVFEMSFRDDMFLWLGPESREGGAEA